MIKSELIQKIAEKNPHLYHRDVERIINTVFDQIIKALEIAEEKAAVAQYGSSDSGASLGDILGAALNKAKKDAEEKE